MLQQMPLSIVHHLHRLHCPMFSNLFDIAPSNEALDADFLLLAGGICHGHCWDTLQPDNP